MLLVGIADAVVFLVQNKIATALALEWWDETTDGRNVASSRTRTRWCVQRYMYLRTQFAIKFDLSVELPVRFGDGKQRRICLRELNLILY